MFFYINERGSLTFHGFSFIPFIYFFVYFLTCFSLIEKLFIRQLPMHMLIMCTWCCWYQWYKLCIACTTLIDWWGLCIAISLNSEIPTKSMSCLRLSLPNFQIQNGKLQFRIGNSELLELKANRPLYTFFNPKFLTGVFFLIHLLCRVKDEFMNAFKQRTFCTKRRSMGNRYII